MRDVGSVLTHGSKRSDSAAELRRESPVPQLCEPCACLEDSDEPAGCLEPERRRHGLLQQGATGHRRVAVRAGETCTGCRDTVELVEYEAERSAGDEHRGRVHHVLGRRTQVHPAAALLPDALDKSAHQGLDRSADPLPLQQQLVPVVAVARAGRSDRGRSGRRDGPREGACTRERGLSSQHRLEPRAPRHRFPQLGRDVERREGAHTAKNVVCPGPWRRMSKRRPPAR